MKFENTDVMGFEGAIKGMRNPLESWNKSDSKWCNWKDEECNICKKFITTNCDKRQYILGKNDLDLAQRLIKAGPEHCKFLRQIFVSVDITAPIYWWKEASTYKIGTTANSTSTMHKLTSQPITKEMFELDDFDPDLPIDYYNTLTGELDVDEDGFVGHTHSDILMNMTIAHLENLRLNYINSKNRKFWKELVRWLPQGWLQTRTWTGSYANIRNMYHQRKNHKLTEWHSFCDWVEKLPYAKELILI